MELKQRVYIIFNFIKSDGDRGCFQSILLGQQTCLIWIADKISWKMVIISLPEFLQAAYCGAMQAAQPHMPADDLESECPPRNAR